MKKKVLGLAIVAMSMISMNVMAQSQQNNTRNCQTKECAGKTCDKKQNCKRGMRPNPFEGMTLTESQKSQLDQLDQARKAKRTEKAKVDKEQKKQIKEQARQAKRAEKKKYLQDVKNIIGPDNYVIFLENIVVDSPSNPKHGKMMKHSAKGHKHGKKHGDRPMKLDREKKADKA